MKELQWEDRTENTLRLISPHKTSIESTCPSVPTKTHVSVSPNGFGRRNAMFLYHT